MRYKHASLALLLFISGFVVFFACRKNDVASSRSKSITDVSTPMDISLAKRYYKVLKKEQGSLVGEAQAPASKTGKTNQKYVVWAKAYAGETSTSTYVEVPLFYNQRPTTIVSTKENPVDPSANLQVLNASFDRLVIYKNKRTGRVDQRIVTFTPDKEYVVNHLNEVSNNHITRLAEDFNGFIKYRKWDGTPLFLLKMKNGKIEKYFSPYSQGVVKGAASRPPGKTVTGAGKNAVAPADLECTTYCDYTYEQDCYYTVTDEGTTEDCGDWVLVATNCWDECVDTGDNGTYSDNSLTGDPCVDYGICDEPAPAELYTTNPLCKTSFKFACQTSDCSYVSTNLLGMRFVSPTDPTQINPFNAYIGFTNYVSDNAMNSPIASQLLGKTETPLQFLNDFVLTKQLITDGDIVRKVAPDGVMSYYFDNYAYSVIATLVSNMSADFTVYQLGAAASVPGNSAAVSLWLTNFSGIVSAFVPGSTANRTLAASVNSAAVYGTAANPCP